MRGIFLRNEVFEGKAASVCEFFGEGGGGMRRYFRRFDVFGGGNCVCQFFGEGFGGGNCVRLTRVSTKAFFLFLL